MSTLLCPLCFRFPCSPSSSSRSITLTVLSEDRLQMKWKEAEGPIQGYKVRVRPISDIPQPELMLTTMRGRATVAGLDSSQEYALQVLVLNGTTEKLLAKRRFTSKKHTLPATETPSEVPDKTPDKTAKEKRKKKKEKERARSKVENKEEQGTTQGKQDEEKPRKTPLPTQPVTGMSPRKPFECDSDATADIMLLVDGSWSIGRTNFRRVRDFLEGLVTPFHIGPNHIQIGLTQYSGDPRTEWHLNNFTTKDQLLEAVRNFRYKGGNTFTGQALLHVMEKNMRAEVGARSDTPFFLVLLTDGKSQDDAIAAANRLKNAGVEIIAVGVKNADEAELRQVASEPVDLNVYNVNDFPLLSKLVARLVHILCGRIEDRMEPAPTADPALSYPSPTDLRFSDLGSREVRLHWTNPAKAVQQYRVVYHSTEGQRPQEVVLAGSESSVLLEGLSSQTLYHMSIFPVYENNVGQALRGTVTTMPLAMPANLEVTPFSFSTLRVSWDAASGATQYMILYSALNHGEPEDEKFSAAQTVVELKGLLPETDYSVTLYALYDEDPSDPVTAVAATFPLPPPLSVHFPMVTHSGLRVSWVPGAVDVPGHRITYSTNHGSDVKQVEVTGLNSLLVQNLSSLSRYLVSVQSNYPQGLSAALTSNITTLKVPSPSDLRVTNFSGSDITVRWEAAADDVVSYLIKWISLSGGELRQLRVSGESEGAILEGVEDDKEYQISLSALYGDGAQSEAVHEIPTHLHTSALKSPSGTSLSKVRHCVLTHDYTLSHFKKLNYKVFSCCLILFLFLFAVSGFDMMEAFGLTQRAHSSVEGVAAEPFVFNTVPTYTLYRDVQLTQSTRFIHPAGFSPEHTISIAFRMLQETPREPFALWQLTDNDFQPKMGVVLDPTAKHLVYFSLDYRGEVQELTFDQPQVHRLFYGSFHKVHLSVSQVSVSLSVDCQHVGERPARPLGNLPTDGFEMLGKLVNTRGPNSGSAPFQLQSFEIVCNTTWAYEDTCCDLPGLVSLSQFTCTLIEPALNIGLRRSQHTLNTMRTRGKPGPRGVKGEKGEQGQKGEVGPPGKPGFEGRLGLLGSAGPRGITVQGKVGPPGARGEKGDPGRPGLQVCQDADFTYTGLTVGLTPCPLLLHPSICVFVVQGFQGMPGHPGPIGERGPSGPVGPTVRPTGHTAASGEPQSMAVIYQLVTQASPRHTWSLDIYIYINIYKLNTKSKEICVLLYQCFLAINIILLQSLFSLLN
uniref:Uncharacterized protein n=1 Tax=Echeneis naucrates TaxID=173247 RepID=A0A665VWB7_ECHNA